MARPKTYDDRLRGTLIDTAAELIAAHGAEALSLRPLAERCGTSTNAVYTLFGSKAGLVMAVITEAAASFAAAQRSVAATDDPLADLVGLGRAYRAWAKAQPALYAVMFGDRVPLSDAPSKAEPGSTDLSPAARPHPGALAALSHLDGPPARLRHSALPAHLSGAARDGDDRRIQAKEDSMEPLLTTVSRAMAAGQLRPGDPMVAATSIWAGIHGWVSLEIAGRLSLGEAAHDHAEEHLAAIATYWLAAPGASCGDVTPG